jgi:hypothetical protein
MLADELPKKTIAGFTPAHRHQERTEIENQTAIYLMNGGAVHEVDRGKSVEIFDHYQKSRSIGAKNCQIAKSGSVRKTSKSGYQNIFIKQTAKGDSISVVIGSTSYGTYYTIEVAVDVRDRARESLGMGVAYDSTTL